MAAVTPLDIVKRTPKTNCGECGFASCLAFGAAVATQGTDPGRCPYLDRRGLEIATNATGSAEERDWALVETLKHKVASLDFVALGPILGLEPADTDRLTGRYLGQTVTIGKEQIAIDGQPPSDPRDCILLYNYLAFGGGPPPTGQWIGMESMPNSISKVKTLATYCEEPIARRFDAAATNDELVQAVAALDGRQDAAEGADFACVVPVLPHLPLKLVFWRSDADDGFEARVKILFDETATDFLDIESLVFCAERTSDRLAAVLAAPQHPI